MALFDKIKPMTTLDTSIPIDLQGKEFMSV